jgi:hypothetical protein
VAIATAMKLAILCNHRDHHETLVNLSVKVVALKHGPLAIDIRVDSPYRIGEWITHPFLHVDPMLIEKNCVIGNIVEDTPAVRALIDELVKPLPNMYTSDDISHYGRLIKAINLFWC